MLRLPVSVRIFPHTLATDVRCSFDRLRNRMPLVATIDSDVMSDFMDRVAIVVGTQ